MGRVGAAGFRCLPMIVIPAETGIHVAPQDPIRPSVEAAEARGSPPPGDDEGVRGDDEGI
jgi:hypothetical protein